MKINEAIQETLARDWTEADLRLAAEILDTLERSAEGRTALRDTDRLRGLLANPSPNAEPAGGWKRFERRLAATQPNAGAHDRGPSSRWGWFPGLALAASLALAFAGWFLYWNQPTPPQTPIAVIAPNLPATPARMTPNEMAQQVGLFDQVSQVFDEKAKWVAVSDGEAELGLAPSPMKAASKLLLLRLTVMRGGKLLSRSDLAIVPGQDADLTLPFEQGQRLRYQVSASPGDPTRLSLWVELQRNGAANQTLAALATELAAHPGDQIKAGELATSAGQYQFHLGVFQSHQPENQP